MASSHFENFYVKEPSDEGPLNNNNKLLNSHHLSQKPFTTRFITLRKFKTLALYYPVSFQILFCHIKEILSYHANSIKFFVATVGEHF